MSRSVLIVGAGPGGLAAAMLLRQAGLEVTVLERLDYVGGRCSSLRVDADIQSSEAKAQGPQSKVPGPQAKVQEPRSNVQPPVSNSASAGESCSCAAEKAGQCTCHADRAQAANSAGPSPSSPSDDADTEGAGAGAAARGVGGGFRFDRGPTFFLYPQILEQIFAACGRDLYEEVEMIRLDPQYRLVFNDGAWGERSELDTTGDLPRMQQELARFSVDDSDNLHRFIADNRRKFEAFKPILQSPWEHWHQLISPAMVKMLGLVRPWASVDRDLRRYFKDPRVRLAFSFQSKYLGMSPFQCPSLFTILSYLEYDYGVYHPVGGCGAVSESMARVARQMGVEIKLNDSVNQVIVEGERVVGCQSTSGEHRADAVVINADFADAMSRLVPDRLRRRWTDRRLKRKRYSCSTFMMYLGIEGRYDELAHHTISLSGDYEKNLAQIEQDHVLPEDPSIYVENPGRSDSSLAPPGHSTLYVLAPVSHQHPNIDWAAQREVFRRRVLSRLKGLGLSDLEPRIRFEHLITPDDWQQGMHIYRGATFNLAHSLGQMLHRRPRNRFEDLPGVYLVGGGTHPGSGLPVIYESARITTRLILDDLGLDPESSQTITQQTQAPSAVS